jgi:hypothetical protein
MPPKGKGKAQEKVVQKAKQKVAEDKTFGLKNKNKSTKVQKYVEQVKNQAVQSNTKKVRKAAERRKRPCMNVLLLSPPWNRKRSPQRRRPSY